MTLYRIHFVDQRGVVFTVHDIDCRDDDEAIKNAQSLDLRFIGMGFDLRDGERLVHQVRPSDRGRFGADVGR